MCLCTMMMVWLLDIFLIPSLLSIQTCSKTPHTITFIRICTKPNSVPPNSLDWMEDEQNTRKQAYTILYSIRTTYMIHRKNEYNSIISTQAMLVFVWATRTHGNNNSNNNRQLPHIRTCSCRTSHTISIKFFFPFRAFDIFRRKVFYPEY